MTTKIRRFNTTSINSVDAAKSLLFHINGTCKMTNFTNASENVDLYDQYTRELAACNEYRFIFTIRPYCTNILFNPFTEIVEWNDQQCTRYILPKTRQNYIQNTEFSSEKFGGYEYFPGFDIMDNHLLRSKVFTYVGDKTQHDGSPYTFNTIKDVQRDAFGKQVKQKFRKRWDNVTDEVAVHLYKVDDLFQFYNEENLTYDSFEVNVSEEDGWYGFTNTSTINDRCKIDGDTTFKISGGRVPVSPEVVSSSRVVISGGRVMWLN